MQKVESAWKTEFYEYPEFQDMWFCLSGANRPFTTCEVPSIIVEIFLKPSESERYRMVLQLDQDLIQIFAVFFVTDEFC